MCGNLVRRQWRAGGKWYRGCIDLAWGKRHNAVSPEVNPTEVFTWYTEYVKLLYTIKYVPPKLMMPQFKKAGKALLVFCTKVDFHPSSALGRF